MSDTITVTVAGFGGTQTLEVERGSSVEVAANGADVSPEAVIRLRGQRVAPDEREDVSLEEGDTLVATPPEAKQG